MRSREMRLRGDEVAVLLADYRMPQMTGLQFLEAAMDLYPGARRILLTAYADTGAAIEAINVVDLDYYLLKPWDPPEEKLYPVIDAQLEAWAASDYRPVPETKVVGHRWSARSSQVREFLARNAVPYRWYAADSPEGKRLLDAAGVDKHAVPLVVAADGTVLISPSDSELANNVGLTTTSDAGLLRSRRHRWRSGRARFSGVRRVRGIADGAGRANRHRRAGRAEFAHRELPRLSRRRIGLAAH